eukprot:scaffold290375_cov22-Tisochrysis_lutea.AAC.1
MARTWRAMQVWVCPGVRAALVGELIKGLNQQRTWAAMLVCDTVYKSALVCVWTMLVGEDPERGLCT